MGRFVLGIGGDGPAVEPVELEAGHSGNRLHAGFLIGDRRWCNPP